MRLVCSLVGAFAASSGLESLLRPALDSGSRVTSQSTSLLCNEIETPAIRSH